MTQISGDYVRCFLCRYRRNILECRKINDTVCPSSKKNLKDVFRYISIIANAEIIISNNEWICRNCFTRVIDYDTSMLRVLKMQSKLAKLVEKVAVSIDSDYEAECLDEIIMLDELKDEIYFDDLIIADSEIDETTQEAFGNVNDKCNTDNESSKFHKYKRKLLPCKLCTFSFRSKSSLEKHEKQMHQKFSCAQCAFSHRNEDYVRLHANIHKGLKETQCLYCAKNFSTKMSTIRHMEAHLNSKKYQCDKCGLCFSQTTVLYNHKLQHEAEEQPLQCEVCHQSFKTKRTYRHHMITHRADRPRHSCEICGKTFTEKYTLKVHKRTHEELNSLITNPSHEVAGDNELKLEEQLISITVTADDVIHNKFRCIICYQPFMNKDLLNKHMEKEHDVILKNDSIIEYRQLN